MSWQNVQKLLFDFKDVMYEQLKMTANINDNTHTPGTDFTSEQLCIMTVGYSAQMYPWRPGVRLYWQLPGNRRGPHMRERGRAHYEGWLLCAQAGGRHFKTYTICSQDRTHLSGWKYYFLHLRSLLSTRSPPPLPLPFSPGDLTGFKRQKFHLKCRAAPSSAPSLLLSAVVGDSSTGKS